MKRRKRRAPVNFNNFNNPLQIGERRRTFPEISRTENEYEKFYSNQNAAHRRSAAVVRWLRVTAHQRRAAGRHGGQRQCRTTHPATAGQSKGCHSRLSRAADVVVFHSRPLGVARTMGVGAGPLAAASASGRHLASGQMGGAGQRLCLAKRPLAFRRARRRRIHRPVIFRSTTRSSRLCLEFRVYAAGLTHCRNRLKAELRTFRLPAKNSAKISLALAGPVIQLES